MLTIVIIITVGLHVCGRQNKVPPPKCPHPHSHNLLQNIVERTSEYDFVDVIKLRAFRWRDYPELSKCSQTNHVNPWKGKTSGLW